QVIVRRSQINLILQLVRVILEQGLADRQSLLMGSLRLREAAVVMAVENPQVAAGRGQVVLVVSHFRVVTDQVPAENQNLPMDILGFALLPEVLVQNGQVILDLR